MFFKYSIKIKIGKRKIKNIIKLIHVVIISADNAEYMKRKIYSANIIKMKNTIEFEFIINLIFNELFKVVYF